MVENGIRSFEAERLIARADSRQKLKAKKALDINVQQNPASTDFACRIDGRAWKINQEWTSTATRELIRNSTEIIIAGVSRLFVAAWGGCHAGSSCQWRCHQLINKRDDRIYNVEYCKAPLR